MDWKSTGIGAAIQAAKADNKLFVVFVHGLFVAITGCYLLNFTTCTTFLSLFFVSVPQIEARPAKGQICVQRSFKKSIYVLETSLANVFRFP